MMKTTQYQTQNDWKLKAIGRAIGTIIGFSIFLLFGNDNSEVINYTIVALIPTIIYTYLDNRNR